LAGILRQGWGRTDHRSDRTGGQQVPKANSHTNPFLLPARGIELRLLQFCAAANRVSSLRAPISTFAASWNLRPARHTAHAEIDIAEMVAASPAVGFSPSLWCYQLVDPPGSREDDEEYTL
jgi:hypothetical protein